MVEYNHFNRTQKYIKTAKRVCEYWYTREATDSWSKTRELNRMNQYVLGSMQLQHSVNEQTWVDAGCLSRRIYNVHV